MTHPNAHTLHLLYQDFSRLDEFGSADMTLHLANRTLTTPPIEGNQACVEHEKGLLDLTGGTLDMDVESIYANDHFGAVVGTLRASFPGEVAMPFCGLWRFVDGKVAEHWENAYDAPALAAALGVGTMAEVSA